MGLLGNHLGWGHLNQGPGSGPARPSNTHCSNYCTHSPTCVAKCRWKSPSFLAHSWIVTKTANMMVGKNRGGGVKIQSKILDCICLCVFGTWGLVLLARFQISRRSFNLEGLVLQGCSSHLQHQPVLHIIIRVAQLPAFGHVHKRSLTRKGRERK